MPANVVKTPHEEHLWDLAKERAKEEGRPEDWPYVMGIFEHMKGSRAAGRAAFAVPYAFAPVRVAGSQLSYQGLSIVLTRDSASARAASRGCYRGLLRGTTGTGGRPPVAAYVGPNALSPLAVLVREPGDRRALLLGFDDEREALAAYETSRGPGGAPRAEYRAAAIGEVAQWAAGLPKRV